jgi:hypothetical protein
MPETETKSACKDLVPVERRARPRTPLPKIVLSHLMAASGQPAIHQSIHVPEPKGAVRAYAQGEQMDVKRIPQGFRRSIVA